MDPKHGAAPPHESYGGARGRGLFSPISFPLFWVLGAKRYPSKNRNLGGVATQGGRFFINRHNNQLKVGCDGEGVMMMGCARGRPCEDDYLLSF